MYMHHGNRSIGRQLAACLLLALPAIAMAAHPPRPAAAPAVALAEATIAQRADEVRATERAFAQTMADRDLAAFGRFIAPDAVFMDGTEASRGAPAIVESWRSLFEGAAAPFSWEPGIVQVLPSGSLALSSGPVHNAKGERSGTFYSVWRREPDGHWRIVLDHGCAACKECKAAAG